MTEGRQILEGLAQTRNFFKQISLVLRTAEDLLKEARWENIGGNRKNKTSDITSHLHRSEQWMPQDIYRFYIESIEEGKRKRGLVIFIGILLDREGAWAGFQEPWVTCGIYQFPTDKDTKDFPFQCSILSYFIFISIGLSRASIGLSLLSLAIGITSSLAGRVLTRI